jgi:Cu+-exporting ATPase
VRVARLPDAPAEASLLALVASAEAGSEHPLGDAIVRHVRDELGHEVSGAESFLATPGEGVAARVDGTDVRVGRASFLAAEGIDATSLVAIADELATDGITPVLVAIGGQPATVIGIADTVKAGSAEAIEALHRLGLRVVMLTGDHRRTAAAIARDLGIDDVRAEVRPDGKAEVVRALGAEHGPVAMVGDGVNDAPALASAAVGIAMGTGTDVAMESAGVTLMRGDLRALLGAVALSRATMRNIRQNLFWAFAYNVTLIPVAMGVLYPINGVLLDPILAAAAMALSSVTVVSNALRLRRFRIPGEATEAAPPKGLAIEVTS